jgi:hypothetical protein
VAIPLNGAILSPPQSTDFRYGTNLNGAIEAFMSSMIVIIVGK